MAVMAGDFSRYESLLELLGKSFSLTQQEKTPTDMPGRFTDGLQGGVGNFPRNILGSVKIWDL